MIYIVGGSGALGSSNSSLYEENEVKILNRKTYCDWVNRTSVRSIESYFKNDNDKSSIVFVASGLLNPSLPFEELVKINHELPKNIIKGVSNLGIRVVTFGSIMEGLSDCFNPYIRSKKLLGQHILDSPEQTVHVTHFRLHTLYGKGKPKDFMFLGQIYEALRNKNVMRMSSGRQLREYHHVNDDLKAIKIALDANVSGLFDVNHGKPVFLSDLADHIFKHFGCEDLLKTGAISDNENDNYSEVCKRPKLLEEQQFRETFHGVICYLETLVS